LKKTTCESQFGCHLLNHGEGVDLEGCAVLLAQVDDWPSVLLLQCVFLPVCPLHLGL